MNSVDCILKTLNFQETERIPVLPVLLLQGAKVLNMKLPEYLQKAEYIALGQEKLVEKFGHDAVYGIPHVVEDVEPFGGELVCCEGAPPMVSKMAWRKWSDLDSVYVPNPTNHESLIRTLKTIELLAKKFKGEKVIVGGAIAPFSLPSMLIGTEKWFELLFWEDELIREPILKRVLQIMKEFCVAWCNAQIKAGADVVVLADGIASATCITRDVFEKLAMPVIKETIASIEGTVVYEPVGRIEPFIDLIPEIGTGLVILECNDDIVECKKKIYGKVSVMGNLNNIELIRWDRDYTLKMCKQLIEKAAPGSGFILSTQGPEIPWDTPDEVILAMVESVKRWGKKV